MDDTVSPLDAGLAWTVDLSAPRDFVGRAALEANGTRAAFVGLILQKENSKAGGVLRAHQKVVTPHGEGEITSGTFSPSMQESIAFACRRPSRSATSSRCKFATRIFPRAW